MKYIYLGLTLDQLLFYGYQCSILIKFKVFQSIRNDSALLGMDSTV